VTRKVERNGPTPGRRQEPAAGAPGGRDVRRRALPAVAAHDGDLYRRIAADLLGSIRCGALADGDPLPTMKDLAARYCVAPSTVHRAITTLTEDGKVVASRGRRARVAAASGG